MWLFVDGEKRAADFSFGSSAQVLRKALLQTVGDKQGFAHIAAQASKEMLAGGGRLVGDH